MTASEDCVVEFQRGLIRSSACKENCECLEDDWEDQRNSMCIALGDCGSSTNYIGVEGFNDGSVVEIKPLEKNQMELENLVKKAGRGIATLGLAATLSGAGCAARMSQGEQDVVAGEVLMQTEDPLLVKMGSILYTLGLIETQKEVARESRTQINVNTHQQQREIPPNVVYKNGKYAPAKEYIWVNPEDSENLRVKKIMGSGFAFTWVDHNQSGNVDNWNECVERKNRFSDESVALALLYETKESFHQNFKMYGPLGKIIYEYDMNPYDEEDVRSTYNIEGEKIEAFVVESKYYKKGYTPQNRGIVTGLSREYIKNTLVKNYGEGEYSAVWRVNGKIQDSITFDIIY